MKLLLKSYLLMTLLAIVINLTTSVSIANHDTMAGGPEKWQAMHQAEDAKLLDQLGLSKEQRQQIEAVKQEAMTQGKAFHHNIHGKRNAFQTYLMSPGADQQTAEAKVDEFSRDMAEMGKLRVRTLFKMRAIMTPQQFQKYAQLKQAEHHTGKQCDKK